MKIKFLMFTGISVFTFVMGAIIYPIIYETGFDDDFPHSIPGALAETLPIPEPIEESFYLCEEGSIEIRNGCVTFENACGEGTKYQDGICVVHSESEPDYTNGKWDNTYPVPFPQESISIFTHLENNKFPIGNYMYIDFTFLLIMIGVTVIGIVFMIRRKRK